MSRPWRWTLRGALAAFQAVVLATSGPLGAAWAVTPGSHGGRPASAAVCPPTSVICLENSLPGNPPSQWDIVGAGDPSIQGYATQMSVNHGETVNFKIATTSSDYRLDIYRIGYYGGMGARQITTVNPSVPLPQRQPTCVSDSTTGLVDCGNWAVSASWVVPPTAVSGVYIAKLVRQDTGGASQIIFVVRDDARGSVLLMQTSDATWQAYNTYGGNSLYAGQPAGRAYKVSYDRPILTRDPNVSPQSFFYNSEYPMVRWLEANGYDVSYTTSIDTASRPAELLEHKTFMSVGHDEYWSNEMRTNVENARNNGVNLAFFSGNEIFWKTRWEPSIDGTSTPFRTMVCYKETLANAKIDPSPQWTGTWRDPRFSPPSDGGRPENALTGTLFMVNGIANDATTVPADFASLREWKNTSVANLQPGQMVTFPAGVLGYEWDEAPDNATRPPGLVNMSSTTIALSERYLLNFGSVYGAGVATNKLTLYKHSSGALVLGTGTTQWSWGLDAVHDRPGTPTDIDMQQFTVNILADMGAQPASIQPGLVIATPSTDTSPPVATITSPASGASLLSGVSTVIQGTATDTGGGVVAAMEVSLDGGATWRQAIGRDTWQFTWTPTVAGPATIMARAIDDSGNIQPTPASVNVNVLFTNSIWSPSTVPAIAAQNDPNSVEIGVKFRTSTAGTINGLRFYKGAGNIGTHVGNLWSSTGQLLARATFTNETGNGWQSVVFSTPVQVTPNTTYVASYFAPQGMYSKNTPYFTQAVVNGPLTALADGTDGGNGVYTYAASTTFPTSTYQSTNYWTDVIFVQPVTSSLWNDSTVPANPSWPDPKSVVLGVKIRSSVNGVIKGIRFYKGAGNTGTHIGSLWSNTGQLLASATFTNETSSGWQQVTFANPVPITAGTTYVASYLAPSGNYATNRPFFTTSYVNPPLTALASGTDGPNGVYAYSSTNVFPTQTFQMTNYWVDVLFSTS
ncbi:DUF4082 domain-containing protein [Sphaerisporangium sp. NPDC051017]|uniref:DUF4082 domain-containing protein n=1 Tax=Sphaerisporangium sp. NPDC051017 TaxID=3154636 RepID=UPI003434A98D